MPHERPPRPMGPIGSVMVKPVGAGCNLACTYCYYPASRGGAGRMSRATLERLFAELLPRATDRVVVAWQGGEPTLAGLPFYEEAVALQARHARPGQSVVNLLQTNGTLLDAAWCRFLRDRRFLVGLSLDGPPRLHDRYRRGHDGAGSAAAAVRALGLLRRHGVEHNVLCVVTDRNVDRPDEVLRWLVRRGARWLQFLPAVGWRPEGDRLAPWAPSAAAYGRFLCRIFDLWFTRLRGHVSVRLFDVLLDRLAQGRMHYCVLAADCHDQLTVEHDGAVYGCDHFVAPRWRLGHLAEGGLATPDPDRRAAFARRKRRLPAACAECRWRALCHGGCPAHRPGRGDGPPAPTALCAAYRAFFAHALPRLERLAAALRPPAPTRPRTEVP